MKNILSLFNGISALHLACDKAGFEINTCYYAEIDKYANKITEKHYPNVVPIPVTIQCQIPPPPQVYSSRENYLESVLKENNTIQQKLQSYKAQ